MTTKTKCPQCGKPTVFEENPFRPFCSERCKMSDLGAWAEEAYFIPGENIAIEGELADWENEGKDEITYH